MKLILVALVVGSGALSWQAHAIDQFLVISGGNDPTTNHYSQYLQTRSLAEHLRERVPQEQVRVYFGAGNNPDEKPLLADVHRTIQNNGVAVNKMLPGVIKGNTPATKQNILRYFESDEVTQQTAADRLFILVGDHGMPNNTKPTNYDNNCINAWALNNQTGQTLSFAESCLSKNDLGRKLSTQVKAATTVFAMSQCFSGGFHQMAVSKTASGGYPTVTTKGLCGFTAVTDDTYASGCTPDADGPSYQGYERYFTEQLTGKNIVTGALIGAPKNSFQEAHDAATLIDMTIDIPLSTSDYYLWQWSKALERPSFAPRTTRMDGPTANRHYQQNWMKPELNSPSPRFASRRDFVLKMEDAIVAAYSQMNWIRGAEVRDFKIAENNLRTQQRQIGTKAQSLSSEIERIRSTKFFPVWWQAIQSGVPIEGMDPVQLNLEKLLFGALENRSDEIDWQGTLEMQLLMALSKMSISYPDRADRLAHYAAFRDEKMFAWGLLQKNNGLAAVVAELKTKDLQYKAAVNDIRDLSKQLGLLRRIQIYRSALAAWATVYAMADTAAMSEIAQLQNCEATAL